MMHVCINTARCHLFCLIALHRFTDSHSCMLWALRRRICNDAAEPLVDGRTIVDSRGTFGPYPACFAPVQHCSLLQLLVMQEIGPRSQKRQSDMLASFMG